MCHSSLDAASRTHLTSSRRRRGKNSIRALSQSCFFCGGSRLDRSRFYPSCLGFDSYSTVERSSQISWPKLASYSNSLTAVSYNSIEIHASGALSA